MGVEPHLGISLSILEQCMGDRAMGNVGLLDGDSVNGTGTAAAPGAAATVATIAAASLPKGKYRVSVLPSYGGVAGVINDMQLKKGATLVGTLAVQAAANTPYARQDFEQVTLDGATALTVVTIAGSAGTYAAVITATKLPD